MFETRTKIVVFITGVLVVTIVIFTYISLYQWKSRIEKLNVDSIRILSSTIVRSLSYAMEKGDTSVVRETMEKIGEEPNISNLFIYDEKGEIIRSLDREKEGGMIDPFYLNLYFSEENTAYFPEKKLYTFITPIENKKECQSCHINSGINGILGIDFQPIWSISRLDTNYIILTNAVGILIIAYIAIWTIISTFVNKPVKQLTTMMEKVEQGDIAARVDIETKDEFGMLGKSFNSMMDRVKEMQDELKEYNDRKMEKIERLASIGQIATGLAHEIRNPLAGISGAIDVISGEIRIGDPNKEIFSEIKVQIDRIRKTVTDLLMFARPSEPERKRIQINNIIRETLLLVQQHKDTEKIVFGKHLSPELPKLYLDPNQIQQILLNILLNAIQAMPKGGELLVKSFVDDDGDFCSVEISDTGQGISKERMNRVFEPFYTSKHKGTGLGLSIAKRIVEEHHGRISVSSELGKGTCFKISFPLQKSVVRMKRGEVRSTTG